MMEISRMPNQTTASPETWQHFQKLTKQELRTEIERLRAWLRYIEGGFIDFEEGAALALGGMAVPEDFEG